MTHHVRHLTGRPCLAPATCEATAQHHVPTHCADVRAVIPNYSTASVPRHRGPAAVLPLLPFGPRA